MSIFKSKRERALAVIAETGGAPPASHGIDINGGGPLAAAVAQQVASMPANTSFKIKHTVSTTGQELEFSSSTSPPMLRPMNTGPTWQDFETLQDTVEALTRRVQRRAQAHRTKLEAEQDYVGVPQGPMLIDGKPGWVFKDASGRYVAYRITESGLEYAYEVKRNE
ncbi:MAG: hypothetical protein AB7T86_10035 [Xanthobacteraceae bacterium]|uniref:hypothetical protein n=1 Tax=Pseudolabrys sp. TaxID=1960880 RepID=UPI003D0BDCF4